MMVEQYANGFKMMDFCQAACLLEASEPEMEIDLNSVKVVRTVDEDGRPILLVIDQMHSGSNSSVAVYC